MNLRHRSLLHLRTKHQSIPIAGCSVVSILKMLELLLFVFKRR